MDNETCEGCMHYEDATCGNPCNWVDEPNVSGQPLRPVAWDDSDSCEYFSPSLECRKVRALEGLLERITFCSSWNANSGMSSWNIYHDKCEPGNRIKAMCDCKDD